MGQLGLYWKSSIPKIWTRCCFCGTSTIGLLSRLRSKKWNHAEGDPKLLFIVSNIRFFPECPTLIPTPGHLCSAANGAQDCLYTDIDLCCCGDCPEVLEYSCVPDSTTGAGIWQSSLCPKEGCGSQGEWGHVKR